MLQRMVEAHNMSSAHQVPVAIVPAILDVCQLELRDALSICFPFYAKLLSLVT